MKVKIKVEKEVDIKYCQLRVEPRYWEDADVNGVEDIDTQIPCQEDGLWCPLIDIDNGIIVNWDMGVTAITHYKVCDAGSYYLQDENFNTILSIVNDYVPNKLIPGEYGDYIAMNIDKTGKITNWKRPDISDFFNDEED